MITLWTINSDNRSEMGLDLAVIRLMYDFYGNETELYGINGRFSFALDKPVYIVGDFNKFESCEPDNVKSCSRRSAEDTVEHTVTMPDSTERN